MSLRSLRLEAGKTQREVAVALDVDQRVYTRWEQGEAKPGADNCLALLEFFRAALHRPSLDLRDLLAPATDVVAPDPAA